MFMVRSWVSLIAVVVLAACSGASASDPERPRTVDVYPSDLLGYEIIEGRNTTIRLSGGAFLVVSYYENGGVFRVSKKGLGLDTYQVEVKGGAPSALLSHGFLDVKGGMLEGFPGDLIGIHIHASKGSDVIRCRVMVSTATKSSGMIAECNK